jgi:assimilatory nitrate reductase catalytic subunit
VPLHPEQTSISSTCAYCGVGCGVDISLDKGKPVALEGTREHPANFGRLCVKGTHLLDTTSNEQRLSSPQIKGHDVTWPQAINKVATSLQDVIKEHGKDAVAFYVSGQLLTEDYYIANKLMKGYIGSANIDTNSRLCMSSAVSAYKRAFGEDVVPCDYTDIEQTDVFVLVGSNAAWTHPVLFQRAQRAKMQRPNMKIIVIDPRKTATADAADLHLQLRPGSDAALFNGLVNFAQQHRLLDAEFIENHTNHFDACLDACEAWTVDKVAEFCELDKADIIAFYRYFCEHKRVLSFYSMGINQSSSGVDKCNAIINSHLATGKLLYKGAGPFSITGQPNAMGGREVGGLANQLAAHLDIENPEHRQRVQHFWQSPSIANKAGKKAVDMFNALKSGKIKAVWIMATNPLVSLPNRKEIEAALQACECVIVSDCVSKNDTLGFADIVLPASGWLEKDGTVTNSQRTISRQRGVVKPYKQAKHDWQIMCEVAKAMGYKGFDFDSPHQIFDEWASMTKALNTPVNNIKHRQLDLSPLCGLDQDQYDALRPKQWPFDQQGNTTRVFENKQFSTANQKANFVPITPQLPKQVTSDEFPLLLNSGRMRDQWHTMTRTARADALNQHSPFPTIELHADWADKLGIKNGEILQLDSAFGQARAYVVISDSVRKNECFMPIHWNAQFASSASVSALYSSVVDPLSGQPESKQVAVKASKVQYKQFVSVFSKASVQHTSDFWVKSKHASCEYTEIANIDKQEIEEMFDKSTLTRGEWISRRSPFVEAQILVKDGQLQFAAFSFSTQKQQQHLPSMWVNSCFDEALNNKTMSALLSATAPLEFTRGKVICSCFNVHEKTINEAIASGAQSVGELGKQLKCGTNCGSCKSELSQMLKAASTSQHKDPDAARDTSSQHTLPASDESENARQIRAQHYTAEENKIDIDIIRA